MGAARPGTLPSTHTTQMRQAGASPRDIGRRPGQDGLGRRTHRAVPVARAAGCRRVTRPPNESKCVREPFALAPEPRPAPPAASHARRVREPREDAASGHGSPDSLGGSRPTARTVLGLPFGEETSAPRFPSRGLGGEGGRTHGIATCHRVSTRTRRRAE